MKLKTVSVYGKNGERRDVTFNTSGLNIITGASKKGKSSLIDIVSYCLGAKECNVAEGPIRETVAWYSVLLEFSDTNVFIGRRAPERGSKSNSSCYLLVEDNLLPPDYALLSGTTNVAGVADFLTGKVGIGEHNTQIPVENTRASTTLGFKHSMYYLFQSQDEVAARSTLFHRQSEPFIPQSIKDTLPYFMGAIQDSRVNDTERLRKLRRERLHLLKEIHESDALIGTGLRKGRELLAEAVSVGIHNSEMSNSDQDLIKSLSAIISWRRTIETDNFELEDRRSSLERDVNEIKSRKFDIDLKRRVTRNYAVNVDGYSNELGEQELRLKSIGLYKSLDKGSCSVCDRPHDANSDFDEIFLSSISLLDQKLDRVKQSKSKINERLGELERISGKLADELRARRQAIADINEARSKEIKNLDLNERRSRVVGRISFYLETLDLKVDSSHNKERLALLDVSIKELEEELDPALAKEILESQLSLVSEDMTRWARELELEHSEHPIRLDATKLTVVAETPVGRTPLNNMGSGENWVGYHLVTYMALAKWFIEQKRPVPRFIFFDQPSQVYFPSDPGGDNDNARDEDRLAVKRMFHWLYKVIEELSPELQVIILDHADIDEPWFQNGIVERWRGEQALIPISWYA